jgi:type 2 lantibiotic biosynthesis protein LanM
MQTEFKERIFRNSDWYKALTLSERSELSEDKRWEASAITADIAPAQRRLERWHSQPPFNNGADFEQRLAADQLTESQLLYLLAEPAEILKERTAEKPVWLAELERAFSEYQYPVGADGGSESPGEIWINLKEMDGYLQGMWPLIKKGVQRVLEGVKSLRQNYSHLPFQPESVINLFLTPLVTRLVFQSTRTLVLELNVARLKGLLEGETPEARFKYFRELLREPAFLLPILREYPVLARQAVITVDYWAHNCVELLERLCRDWPEILGTLAPGGDPGLLTEVVGEAGDVHRRGQTVKILKFSNGFKLVYKPHSLSVDVHFGELLEWLNGSGLPLSFRTLKVIDRRQYGWVEFVEPLECSEEDEIRRFYQRQGSLLALLYALEATDFHLENLIASGEHPFLIDLESLFHPRVKNSAAGPEALALATDTINNSVLRIGLLPQRIWGADDKEGIDLSGLGGAPGQLTPFPVLTYENQATDEMRAVRKRLEMSGGQNRPKLKGEEVELQNYTGEVINGFTSVYKLLLREREQLLAPGGPLMSFAEDEVRSVLRATRSYSTLLMESFHPDVLRDALDRNRLFDRLWNWSANNPEMARVIPAEVRDLERGDIPFFSCRPNSCDLWTSDNVLIPDFFEGSSLSGVRRRLHQLSEEDLTKQVWFISASIASLTLGDSQKPFAGFKVEPSAHQATRERLLGAARKVADRLESLALSDEHNVNWIGMTFMGGRSWTLLPLIDDFYNGTQGVTFFLAYLGDVLQEERYTAIARKVAASISRRVDTLLENAEQVKGEELGAGGYSGLGTYVYTLAHLGQLWKAPELLAQAEAVAELIPSFVEKDKTLDIVGGSAGCILNLLALYRATSSARVLDIARRCGDFLIERAKVMEHGVAWETNMLSNAPLTGFSHGASGIAYALLELAAAAGDERYRKTAFDAFAYERSVFSESAGNWPDFREDRLQSDKDEGAFMVAWCHGAPGVGLGRLRAFERSRDAQLRNEIETAVETTLQQGLGLNHSPCHGDLGNLEFLFEAGRVLRDPALSDEVGRVADSLLNSIDTYGWICGTPQGIETPGLMTGLAGIGYQLLRLAEPDRVPSILTLAPPASVAQEDGLADLVEARVGA